MPVQCPVGRGALDLSAILSEIRRYDPNATLVLEGTTGDAIRTGVSLINSKWGQ